MTKLLFLTIMSSICLLGCSMTNKLHGHNDKVVYYEKGVSTNLVIDNPNILFDLVRELVKGTDDSFRLIVTKSTIDNAKQKRCVEITFANEINVSMNNGKSLSFSKILISLKNDDEHNDNSSVVFYCGKKVYFTPPYINSKGAKIADEIMRLCLNAM